MKHLNLFKQFEDNSNNPKINVVKIDSRNRTINLVTFDIADKGEYTNYIKYWNYNRIPYLIGHGCEHFEAPYSFENGDTLYTDEEFLIRDFDIEVDENGMYDPSKFGFIFTPFSLKRPLWGNGVIVGTDLEEGESISVKTPLEIIRQKILFLEKVNNDLNHVKIWQWDGTKYTRTR